MRLKYAIAVTLACMGFTLAACQRQQAQNPPAPAPAAPQTEAAAPQAGTNDLSPEASEKYLADNAKKPGVTVRPSGLQYRVIKSGSGKSPATTDMVTVTYKGMLINGKVFDQTMPGQTAMFPVNMLIPGWTEALPLMKEGDEWELVIPASLAYGHDGAGDAIPPDQTLIFDMTLIQVN